MSNDFRSMAGALRDLYDAEDTKRLLQRIALVVRDSIRSVTRVRTGQLRDGTEIEKVDPTLAVIANRVPYGVFVHDGTKPHTITAKKQALVFQIGGRQVFARKVQHPGTKADPFFDRGLAAAATDPEAGAWLDEVLANVRRV